MVSYAAICTNALYILLLTAVAFCFLHKIIVKRIYLTIFSCIINNRKNEGNNKYPESIFECQLEMQYEM